MECVVSAVVEKRLGALPVAAEFLRRLGLAGTVDRLCPGRDIAHLTHGQVIETLVANRLTAPAPLWRVDDWAREWAVEEVFGIEPELLTSMSLHGAYPADDQDEDYPQVKHGHPKDRRYDLKQIQTGLAVTGDGGIPLLSRVIDGGAAEISQITGAMKALRAIAGPKEFLLIADSKLVSYRNITTLIKAGTGFIAPAPASTVDDAGYAALDLDAATVVDYTPPGTRTPRPSGARPTACWRTPTSCPDHASAIRRWKCAGSWCTPPATPKVSSGPGTNAWPRPGKSSTSCSAGLAAATTTLPRRSPPASA